MLLDKRILNVHKDVFGTTLRVPRWGDWVTSELEIRSEAFRSCREEAADMKEAWWPTLEDNDHRRLHRFQNISIPN